MSISKVYLGLPAYNEKESIYPLFDKIVNLQKTLNVEVLFYDDGCKDGTKEAVHDWTERLKITYIDGVINKGLGAGLNALLSHFAKNGKNDEVLVIMDCDDTHDPVQIPQMISVLNEKKQADVVIASRYRKNALIKGVPKHRILMSFFAALLYKMVHPIKGARDYTCGYRLYSYSVINKLFSSYSLPLIKEKGFACMVELLLKLKKTKAKVIEIPLVLNYDSKRSASKMDVSGNAFRLLKKLVDWKFRGLK